MKGTGGVMAELRAYSTRALVDPDLLAEDVRVSRFFVLFDPGHGGPEVSATGRSTEGLLWLYTSVELLVEACGDGQPYIHLSRVAGTLQVVKDDMQRVREMAIAGGLEVQGPLVLRPEGPGPRPVGNDFVGNPKGYEAAKNAYLGQVADFNARAEVFNNCLEQLDNASRLIPERLQATAAANPGQLTEKVSKAWKSLPWAGTTLTLVNEAWGAATGEQTWGKAVASSGAVLGGGALGGALGSWFCAPFAPPIGPILCGTGGATLGGMAADKIVDFGVPDEKDLPKPVDELSPRFAHPGPGYPG